MKKDLSDTEVKKTEVDPEKTPSSEPLVSISLNNDSLPFEVEQSKDNMHTETSTTEGSSNNRDLAVAGDNQGVEPFSASKYFDTDKENLTNFFKESVESMDAIAQRGEAVARNMQDLKQAITNKRKALELALVS